MKLHAYQAAFFAALWQDPPPDASRALSAQPGFAVYRNTVMKGCIDALAANYPAVLALVGDDWFRAAAAVFVRAAPPTRASLLDYGQDFADFLSGFEPAASLPYLGAVARLDRHWTEAHLAPDARALTPAGLAALPAAALTTLRLTPQPATRWCWADAVPVHTLWSLNRGREPMPADGLASLHWSGEGALTTRRDDTVLTQRLSQAGCALLDACADGAPFELAAGAALAIDPGLDLPALVAQLLEAGAFAAAPAPSPVD